MPTQKGASGAQSVEHFDVAVTLLDKHVHLGLRGELDIAAADVLRDAFERRILSDGARGGFVEVDVSELTYCDSSGLHALLGAVEQCEKVGTRLRLVGAHGTVLRVLEITHTLDILEVNANADGNRSANG